MPPHLPSAWWASHSDLPDRLRPGWLPFRTGPEWSGLRSLPRIALPVQRPQNVGPTWWEEVGTSPSNGIREWKLDSSTAAETRRGFRPQSWGSSEDS